MQIRPHVRVLGPPAAPTQLFDPRRGGVFALGEVASVVVAALAKGATQGELLAAVLERFEVSPLTARVDLAGFLAQLEKHGLVEA